MHRSVPGWLLAAAWLLAGAAACATTPPITRLSFRPAQGDPCRVRVVLEGAGAAALRRFAGRGETERIEAVFFLAVRHDRGASRPLVPVLAAVRWTDTAAVLEPRVSLTPGLRYVARFDGPRVHPSLPRLSCEYWVPPIRSPSDARIVAVYPTQRVVPANLLKFYVYFDRPMAEGSVFRYVRLLDSRGRAIPQAFNERELWDERHRRLTLWIMPGRTKRGLGLSESLGPVLRPYERYTLAILPGLPDQHGRPLARGLRHAFRTAGFDRERPRLDTWRVFPPAAGTRQPLRVRFPEPLDYPMAHRLIRVETAGGRAVAGRSALSRDARAWMWTPVGAWRPGDYRLVVDGFLEDLAGNNLVRLFETPVGQGARPPVHAPAFRLGFRIRAGERPAARGSGPERLPGRSAARPSRPARVDTTP